MRIKWLPVLSEQEALHARMLILLIRFDIFIMIPPRLVLESVCSAREESRKSFAGRYGFKSAVSLKDFIANNEINTVYILGPNNVHYQHLASVIEMPSMNRIYLEKPVCSNKSEEKAISELSEKHPDVKIQVGFQYLLTASVRDALAFWKSGELGKPLHFDLKYYHGDYLRKGISR